ncbi:hypothetical protein [Leptolyngbya sp. FACHB-261]|uniref:hypothetical protein n=1 Tax=Leptolyngbya sp. FACHB-261 TaxID=2692806 RepID=UPI00168498C6|nr:hypothetical protein [Leptolyngbya sp. FACHB-261]MBD2103112.1 hypothetical protein [Leptolyngbya sp. FACHB-261]
MFSLKPVLLAAVGSFLLVATAGVPAQAAIISGKISGTVTRLIGGYVPETVKLGSPIRGSYSYDTEILADSSGKRITAFDLSIGDNPFRFSMDGFSYGGEGSVDPGAGHDGSDLLRVTFGLLEAGAFFYYPGLIGFGGLTASASRESGFLYLESGPRIPELFELFGYIESNNIVAGPNVPDVPDVPAIPAPGLATGLIGLAIAGWRKQQRQEQGTTKVS